MLTRCNNCIIATDDFNRADADDPGANWDEQLGVDASDYDIDNNELVRAGGVGTDEEIQFLVAHPGGASAPSRVRVRFKLGGTSRSAGIFVSSALGSDNGLYTFVQHNGTCATLIFVVSGSTSTIQYLPGLTTDEWHTLEVCYDPGDTSSSPTVDGMLRAKVKLANGRIYGNQIAVTGWTDGAYVGLSADTGVRFDDFRFDWMGGINQDDHVMCPDCNTPCLIEEDDFEADEPCKWDEVSGIWTRDDANDGEANCASAGVMLCRVHHPQLKTHHYVTVRAYVDTGITPRVLINSNSDASSYHWAQLEWDDASDTLTLSIGLDGSELDSVTSNLPAAGFVALTVCFDGTVLTGEANGESVSSDSTAVTDGIYAGLAGQAGGERFNDFEFQKHYSTDNPEDRDCPNCLAYLDCQCGVDNPAPRNFKITISGVVGCDSHNRTVIAVGGCGVSCWCGVSAGCVGGVDGSGVPSSDPSWAAGASTEANPAVELYFWPLGPPSITVCVSYIDSGFVQRRHRFRKEYSERPTCATLTDVLPLFSGSGAPCEYLNAICTIEALP